MVTAGNLVYPIRMSLSYAEKMPLSQAKKDKINQIMEAFDWIKVKKIMDCVDWRWYDAGLGKDGSEPPTIAEIMNKGRDLLEIMAGPDRSDTGSDQESSASSGGFRCTRWSGYNDEGDFIDHLELEFIAESGGRRIQ